MSAGELVGNVNMLTNNALATFVNPGDSETSNIQSSLLPLSVTNNDTSSLTTRVIKQRVSYAFALGLEHHHHTLPASVEAGGRVK